MSLDVVYYSDKNNTTRLCVIKKGTKFIHVVYLDPKPRLMKVKVSEEQYMSPVPERYDKPLIIKRIKEKAELIGVKKFFEEVNKDG